MTKILIPVTNHATLGETNEPNGTYAPELTHALAVFLDAGYDYDLVSIQGGNAPLYGTDAEDDAVNDRILADENFQSRVQNTIPVSQINIDDYDGIFYPGGFGLLSDLAKHEGMAALAAQHYQQGGVLSAVCHGPAALLPIVLGDDTPLIADKSVTGFTREEEIDFGTIEKIPFLLEESLARTAGEYRKKQPWQSLVIDDDRVITGQNPASAHDVGEALVKRLSS